MKIVIELDIDFEMLKEQKKTIIKLHGEDMTDYDKFNALEGVLNLFDAIQDQAVEKYGLSEKEVFSLSED